MPYWEKRTSFSHFQSFNYLIYKALNHFFMKKVVSPPARGNDTREADWATAQGAFGRYVIGGDKKKLTFQPANN